MSARDDYDMILDVMDGGGWMSAADVAASLMLPGDEDARWIEAGMTRLAKEGVVVWDGQALRGRYPGPRPRATVYRMGALTAMAQGEITALELSRRAGMPMRAARRALRGLERERMAARRERDGREVWGLIL